MLIHVDQGRPEHLGQLVRALLPEHPNLDVFTDVRAVLQAEPGSILILVPKPEDAEWLNLNRPIFAQRQLKVVLYCDRQTTLALADRAVDFFDWVSQHHTCPDGPPDFAVQGFRQAVANQVRKLLASEWQSLHVDLTEAGEVSAKPTRNSSVNDFIHLFLAQSNTSPPLPPESRARALRILAEVLLAQGRYEEAEDVAQQAHETALHAPEIACPEIWRALALLGRARALHGRHAEGKKDLEHAIELATNSFGNTHAEVARLWLDLARIQARNQDAEPAETIRKVIEVWERAHSDAKERDAALEELRRMIQSP